MPIHWLTDGTGRERAPGVPLDAYRGRRNDELRRLQAPETPRQLSLMWALVAGVAGALLLAAAALAG
jgi:Tfp pilus assembly protein PilN